jgi:protein involved in polysaccharide export with SLBB domain
VTQPVPIIEVIAKAGGLKNVAKRREIAVIRGGLKSPEIAVVNIKRLIDGDFSQNIMVQPGDIVYVPTSALGKYYNFIDGVLRSISPLIQGTIISRTVNP